MRKRGTGKLPRALCRCSSGIVYQGLAIWCWTLHLLMLVMFVCRRLCCGDRQPCCGCALVNNPWFRLGHLATILVGGGPQAWLGIVCPLDYAGRCGCGAQAAMPPMRVVFIEYLVPATAVLRRPDWVFIAPTVFSRWLVLGQWWRLPAAAARRFGLRLESRLIKGDRTLRNRINRCALATPFSTSGGTSAPYKPLAG